MAMLRFLCVLTIGLGVSSALAQTQAPPEPPVGTLSDDSLLLVEQGTDNLWVAVPAQGKPPRYSDKLLHRRVESCAAVGMVIERDGTTSGHRVLNTKIRPDARAKDAELVELVQEWAIASARSYTFTPGRDNPTAKPGYTAMWFAATRGNDPGAADACAVHDLRQALSQLEAG